MARVILVRHGQTIWNHEMKYQGHKDIPLTEEGYSQARKVAARLRHEKIAAVYASDLGRALETAKIVATAHNVEVKIVPALREINFGLWEGLTHADLVRDYAELLTVWYERPGTLQIPQGETFAELKTRAYKAVCDLAAAHKHETIIVVSHGGTIRTIICAALNLDLNHLWSIRQDNTAVNIIEFYDHKAIVTLLNDTHHLTCPAYDDRG